MINDELIKFECNVQIVTYQKKEQKQIVNDKYENKKNKMFFVFNKITIIT